MPHSDAAAEPGQANLIWRPAGLNSCRGRRPVSPISPIDFRPLRCPKAGAAYKQIPCFVAFSAFRQGGHIHSRSGHHRCPSHCRHRHHFRLRRQRLVRRLVRRHFHVRHHCPARNRYRFHHRNRFLRLMQVDQWSQIRCPNRTRHPQQVDLLSQALWPVRALIHWPQLKMRSRSWFSGWLPSLEGPQSPPRISE